MNARETPQKPEKPEKQEKSEKPEKTPDGHHILVGGRKWRATDPAVPEEIGARLRRHLMAARRAVRAATTAGDAEAERAARARVSHAKNALGERGTPWWEQSEDERRGRWEHHLAELDADTPDQPAPSAASNPPDTPDSSNPPDGADTSGASMASGASGASGASKGEAASGPPDTEDG